MDGRTMSERLKDGVGPGPLELETCALFCRCGLQRRLRSLQVCHGRLLREFGGAALQV